MKLDRFTTKAQDGLRRFALDVHQDELMMDDWSGLPQEWAWLFFQLRNAPDRPEWFPHGKWATVQFLEAELDIEAAAELTEVGQR